MHKNDTQTHHLGILNGSCITKYITKFIKSEADDFQDIYFFIFLVLKLFNKIAVNKNERVLKTQFISGLI
ncbi:hypothetical protein AMR41_30445 [Hapalosiphon sp. MRB220]|nr:hypothetical protein AMR41_30445 [Hapalosiphon sp. MRB220]